MELSTTDPPRSIRDRDEEQLSQRQIESLMLLKNLKNGMSDEEWAALVNNVDDYRNYNRAQRAKPVQQPDPIMEDPSEVFTRIGRQSGYRELWPEESGPVLEPTPEPEIAKERPKPPKYSEVLEIEQLEEELPSAESELDRATQKLDRILTRKKQLSLTLAEKLIPDLRSAQPVIPEEDNNHNHVEIEQEELPRKTKDSLVVYSAKGSLINGKGQIFEALRITDSPAPDGGAKDPEENKPAAKTGKENSRANGKSSEKAKFRSSSSMDEVGIAARRS